jgi:hypothetical protein
VSTSPFNRNLLNLKRTDGSESAQNDAKNGLSTLIEPEKGPKEEVNGRGQIP